ncbi:hypothetical protein E2C01_048895 [Portunus trituberculatus]|uniref:Uncharacterized protein n=1 Tax=Portunus trituberculatus TaxID=210409 RepID=A0A5B7GC88_PORTR|nr:hypothetical protein [Portunus trituberculatus]
MKTSLKTSQSPVLLGTTLSMR